MLLLLFISAHTIYVGGCFSLGVEISALTYSDSEGARWCGEGIPGYEYIGGNRLQKQWSSVCRLLS